MGRFWVLALAASLTISCALRAQEAPQIPAGSGATLITLGTGSGPPPRPDRMQPANLLVVDGKSYLIDAGEGVAYQLVKAGVRPGSLGTAFLTHLHIDHTLGMSYLMASDWALNRKAQLPIYGPPGTSLFVKQQIEAIRLGTDLHDVELRQPIPVARLYPALEVKQCGITEIYRDTAVRVTSVCNSHFSSNIYPKRSYGRDRSLSYRFDTRYGSVTFSGDTGPSPDLEQLAQGSDILVTEVFDEETTRQIIQRLRADRPKAEADALIEAFNRLHLTAPEAGKLATRAGVKTLVLSHLGISPQTDMYKFVADVAKEFGGKIVVASDMMRFPLESDQSPAK